MLIQIADKTFRYYKETDIGKLRGELESQNFDVISLTSTYEGFEPVCILVLSESETKDPSDTINSHVFIPETQSELEQLKQQLAATQEAVDFLLMGGM